MTFKVLCAGNALPESMPVTAIEIERDCNRIPVARITFIDGAPETGKFEVADSEDLAWGKELSISLGRMGVEEILFKGVIVGKHLQTGGTQSQLVVEASESAIRMTGARKSRVSEQTDDSAAISALIGEYSGLTATVGATNVQHRQLVQYYATDWDFMLCRAEANGMIVLVQDDEIIVKKPELSQAAKYAYTFGEDILSFRLESDLRNLSREASGTAWNIETQKPEGPADADPVELPYGNLGDDGTKAMGDASVELFAGTYMKEDELKAWASGHLLRTTLSALSGTLEIDGHNALPGDTVELKGSSKIYNGKIFVTGITHRVSNGSWITDVRFGVSPESFALRYPVRDESAAGLLPGVNGLQIGTVEAYEADPENFFRFKVKVPAMGNDDNRVWARLTTLSGGKDHSVVFFPEKDDEVILGFLNDDPRQAVILGSVYNPVNKPLIEPTDTNAEKGFVTKMKSKLVFNDEKKTITLSTENQEILIDEDKKSVTIKDMNDNSIVLDDKGITLKSGKDLILEAAGDVKVNASGNVEIKGSKVDVI